MLDSRLNKCAEFVSGNGITVDVGTDHALLAAELINTGKCRKVIASDVREGPLEAAGKTVERYGISDKVELILSDGLEQISLEGVSDVVIAGMGGETIAEIVSRDERLKSDNIALILQPMTKPEILRKELYKNGFTVTDEQTVEDGEKLYVVMRARSAESGRMSRELTETEALSGFFEGSDPVAKKYRMNEAKRLMKIAESLEKAGKIGESTHYKALSYKVEHGTGTVAISEIMSYLDTVYPFALQEKWDNSGLLVENEKMECSKVLLSLDITNRAVEEANAKGAQLIISHHPVIFDARKKIRRNDPVFKLILNNIAALCMHTNVDIAGGGTNGVILRKLCEKLAVKGDPEPFEELGNGNNLGWIIDLAEPADVGTLAEVCKEIFGCEYVRASAGIKDKISKIAFCSGSGGSMLQNAIAKNCDVLITGDVKHDVWIDADNSGIVLFDCGHFHTENLVLWEFRRVLEEKFPMLDVEIAEASADPCVYY